MSKPFTLRLPGPMQTAAEAKAKAADKSLADWIRGLIAKETGTSSEMPQGFATMSETRRRKVAASGGRAKAEKISEK